VSVPAIRRWFAGMDGPRRDDEDAPGGSGVPSSFELEARGTAVDARDDPVVVHVRWVSVPHERRVQCFDAPERGWPEEARALFQKGCAHRKNVQDQGAESWNDRGMTGVVRVLNLADPTRVTSFPFGRFELFRIGDLEIGRAVYAPGWRWTEHLRPMAATELCEVEHVGLVVSGRAAVKMRDGSEITLTPGDFFSVPPGHDSWVVGSEQYVSLHFLGADRYASPGSGHEVHLEEEP
jgi:mannose-6-phosphate isomerase-like protein (cupin superfamily)